MHHLSLYIHHKRLYKLDNEKLEFFFKEKQDKEKKTLKKILLCKFTLHSRSNCMTEEQEVCCAIVGPKSGKVT